MAFQVTDGRTLERVRFILAKAQEEGREAAELLDQYGLLATMQRRAEVEYAQLSRLIELFGQLNVANVVGGGYATGSWSANDFMAGVCRILSREAEKVRPNG